MRNSKASIRWLATLAALTLIAVVLSPHAAAQTEAVLSSFNITGSGGALGHGSLVFDAAGNLYGVMSAGGTNGGGTAFELIPTGGGIWTETVLHTFNSGVNDGDSPQAGMIFDAAGNLYGTTYFGGPYSYGTVFELSPNAGGGWTEKTLHAFGNNTDGSNPVDTLIFDPAGNLYGTTFVGGVSGLGTVFELTPKSGGGWTEKLLHSFSENNEDGHTPLAGLVFDDSGNLYGTTGNGGSTQGGGTVFELTPGAGGRWTEKILHRFSLDGDGDGPFGSLIFDSLGNLYGTTTQGGRYGYGTVFELTPGAGGRWTEKILHNFNDATGGFVPYSSLIFDAAGNLYGTTEQGGAYNKGTVFELTPGADGNWTETVLHNFDDNGIDGEYPLGGLIFDGAGNLYGTTDNGGDHTYGTVFEVTP